MSGEPTLTLRDLVRKVAPWAKTTPGLDWGYKYLYSIAQAGDLIIQEAVEAGRLRFPSDCPEDALPFHGRDRGLRRGPHESADSFRARLLAWRTFAKKLGSAEDIVRNVQTYAIGNGFQLPTVRLVTNTGTWFTLGPGTRTAIERVVSLPGPSNWDWDGHPELWDRFWIILYASEWAWDRDGTWGDGEIWGNDGSSTIGSTATPVDVVSIRQLVADAQAGDALCVSIIVSFDDAAFAPDGSGTLPDGLWAHHGKRDGSGNVVVARSEDALYWDGTT